MNPDELAVTTGSYAGRLDGYLAVHFDPAPGAKPPARSELVREALWSRASTGSVLPDGAVVPWQDWKAGEPAVLSPLDEHDLSPALIALDYGGNELHALLGAEETVREYRPDILCRVDDAKLRKAGHSAEELVEWLEALGYTVSAKAEGEIEAVFEGA